MVKCLIVDDDQYDRENYARIIENLGYRCDLAKDSIEGFKAIKRQDYNLVLLDIIMPDFKNRRSKRAGIELLKLIREHRPMLPVIMISALDEGKVVRETIKKLNAIDYIVKGDLSDDEIREAIKNALNSKYSEKEIFKMIRNDEGQELEYKATLRWDSRRKEVDPKWWIRTFKVIVSFLNTNGGKLLMGVRDDKAICGIGVDRFDNDDKYLLHFNQLVHKHIGDEYIKYIHTEFIKVRGKTILLVNCLPSNEPAFLKINRDKEDFYIRNKNLTQRLSTRAAWLHLKKKLKQ